MPGDPQTASIDELAKHGSFEELCRRADAGAEIVLHRVFERAVTDFRTVKRRAGHQQILHWCLDQGLDLTARAGWLNQSMVCLAARYGNQEIVAAMVRHGLPQSPFAHASVGDLDFLQAYASHHALAEERDVNGANLLCSAAGSGLGRHDESIKRRLTETCQLLLEHGVCANHEIDGEPFGPAFLCAAFGGNAAVMRLLIEHSGLRPDRVHQCIEHALEPHTRSGEPFYDVAEAILQSGFDLNAIWTEQGRTLLHGAANRGTLKPVRWLLEHGADPNICDTAGRTPLHVCAMRNTGASVLKLLIDAGAEPRALYAAGITPLDYARQNNRVKAVAYLESIGPP